MNIFLAKSDKEKNSFKWTAASGIVYSLSTLIFMATVTQVLGKDVAAIYAIATMVAQQLLTVGRFSVRNYQASDVKGRFTFGDYFTFRTLSVGAMLIGTVGWIYFAGYRGETMIVVFLICLYRMFECVGDVCEGLYQQRLRVDVSGRSMFWKNVIINAGFVIAILVTKKLVVAAATAAVLSGVVVCVIDIPLVKHFDRFSWHFNGRVMASLLIAVLALFVSSFLYVYINNSPKYAIENVMGKASVEFTDFTAIFMPVFAVDLLASFTMRTWITKMAICFKDGKWKELGGYVIKQLMIIALITAVSMAGMYFLGGKILSFIYGVDLDGYSLESTVLMLAGGMVAVYNLFENITIIYRHQHIGIVLNVVSGIIAMIVVPILTKVYGVMGASLGYLAVNTARAIMYAVVAWIYTVIERRKPREAQ